METFKRLSDTISVHNRNSSIFLVNGEWTFILPDGLYYELDSEFDGGISGGIDLSGSVKPMVIKGLYDGSKHLFNFALQEHYNFFGNGNTIIDCKYDNRFVDADPSSEAQKIITDEDDLYVDITAENIWPFGIQVQLRARSPKMTPFDFDAVINCGRSDYDLVMDKLKELAYSIRLSELESESESIYRTSKAANSAQTVNNCIIENGVLVKYIGRETDIVLPEGIEKLADGLFSGRKIRSIVIPEGVHTIGRRAFENCLELEKVSLPSTLEELGGYAFVDCHKLKSINLGDKLTSIEDSVFSECFELRNVIIPRNVERIEAFAFKSCRKFTSIVIPDGVESISFQAFAYCKNLSYLYIPASVGEFSEDFLGNTPFVGCDMLTVYCPSGSAAEEYCHAHGISCCAAEEPELQEAEYDFSDDDYESAQDNRGGATFSFGSSSSPFSVEIGIDIDEMEQTEYEQENECDFKIEDGVLFEYRGHDEVVILPQGIEKINSFAFNECEMKKIVFSDSVREIEFCAFDECTKLKEIVFNDGLEIIDCNFDDFPISEVDIPDSVKQIKDYAFSDTTVVRGKRSCEGLAKYVANNHGTFELEGEDTSEYVEIELENCILIGDTLLKYIGSDSHITLPQGIRHIGNKAFSSSPLISVQFNGDLETIGEEAFSNTNLESLSFPSSLRSIGDYSFYECKNLKEVSFCEGLTEIGEGAFSETPISELHFPDSLQTIGSSAFDECKLKSVAFGAGLRRIGHRAFYETNIKKLVFPAGLTYIGDWAFTDCGKLSIVSFSGDLEYIGEYAFRGCGKLSSVTFGGSLKELGKSAFSNTAITEFTVPEGVVCLRKDTFYGCEKLQKLVLPNSLLIIGDSAVRSCEELTEVTLNDGLRRIEDWAFSYCPIQQVVIPQGAKAVRSCAFKADTKKKKVKRKDYADPVSEEFLSGGFDIRDGILNCYLGKGGDVEIPDGVIEVAPHAFEDAQIKSVIVPGSVKRIGKYAFCNCSKLVKITFSEGLEEIDDYAFMGTKIEELVFPDGLVRIGNHAFEPHFRNSIHKLSFGSGLAFIGDYAFGEFGAEISMKELSFPDSLIEIGDNAFSKCEQLENLCLGSGIKKIGSHNFEKCEKLTTLVLPEGLRSIGSSSFSECGITEITLPESLTQLGFNALCYSPQLSRANIKCRLGPIISQLFKGCAIEKLEIPQGVKIIESYSFMDSSLKCLVIPESVTYISDNFRGWAGDDNDNFVLTVVAGSYAEGFARKHNIPFVLK